MRTELEQHVAGNDRIHIRHELGAADAALAYAIRAIDPLHGRPHITNFATAVLVERVIGRLTRINQRLYNRALSVPERYSGQVLERARNDVGEFLVEEWDMLLRARSRDGKIPLLDAFTLIWDVYKSARTDGEARVRDLHVSDGAGAPFCNECGHGYPCATIRAYNPGPGE